MDNLAYYFTKLAREMTYSHTKESRGGHAPFSIVSEGVRTGDATDLDLWAEWEQGSFGKRQLTWSLGEHDLRKLTDLAEQTDEEIAQEELAGEEVLVLPHPTWKILLERGLTTDLLDAAEITGIVGACAFLQLRGLAWVLVGAK